MEGKTNFQLVAFVKEQIIWRRIAGTKKNLILNADFVKSLVIWKEIVGSSKIRFKEDINLRINLHSKQISQMSKRRRLLTYLWLSRILKISKSIPGTLIMAAQVICPRRRKCSSNWTGL